MYLSDKGDDTQMDNRCYLKIITVFPFKKKKFIYLFIYFYLAALDLSWGMRGLVS